MYNRYVRRSSPLGDTPLYKLNRYVRPQWVWFLSRFALKWGVDFNDFGLKNGIVNAYGF